MNVRCFLKNVVEKLPRSITRFLVSIPYSFRLGPSYLKTINTIQIMQKSVADSKKAMIYCELKQIVDRVYECNIAYRTLYQRAGYNPAKFVSFEYFQDIPIVNKSVLREFSLNQRTCSGAGHILLNTGGSTGSPFSFYVDEDAFAREWAHMHWIWLRKGFRLSDLKLTFRGKNLGNQLVRFNAVHNEFVVNSYNNQIDTLAAISSLVDRYKITWLHGYPSLIAEFLHDLKKLNPNSYAKLQSGVKGVLLGSEFPAPHYRDEIEIAFGPRSIISWYGHSEMCILAYETNMNKYVPLHSYGYCEVVDCGFEQSHLVGTSYYNSASPFIRYDTEDCVKGNFEQGILKSFNVIEGRFGDFVIDKNNNRISLTALIFGRHHKAFDDIVHVQVQQLSVGSIAILFVPRNKNCSSENISLKFDFSNVNIDVAFKALESPIKSPAGKIMLLVK